MTTRNRPSNFCRENFSSNRLTRKGWEFYTQNHLWPADGEVTLEGMKYNIRIYADQTGMKGPLPDPAKFVDQSYLSEALRELPKQ
jgi:hypothetical protein